MSKLELINVIEKYMAAMDAIYNHNAAARSAVIQHMGLKHYVLPDDLRKQKEAIIRRSE